MSALPMQTPPPLQAMHIDADGPATPPSLGEGIRQAVAGARVVELDAAHPANVEQSEAFNAIEFLTS